MTITSENVKELLKCITDTFEENKEDLCKYDRAIGDGDHGDSMARGSMEGYKAVSQLEPGTPVSECFKIYSRSMRAAIGGAIGPIFSTVVNEIGKASKNSGQIDVMEYAEGLKDAAEKVMQIGGAVRGDKTLVDALVPAAEAADPQKYPDFKEMAYAVKEAAYEGVQSTIPMQAKMGRSRFLREKSVGHQDAGATSLYLMLQAVYQFVVLKKI